MKEKKGQAKLLAAVVALTVVACAMISLAPAADAEGAGVSYEASIGETPYETLELAIAKVQDDETIVLQNDVTLEKSINLDGYTIDGLYDTDKKHKISFLNGAGIKLTDGTLKDLILDGKSEWSILWIDDDSLTADETIIIDGVNFTGDEDGQIYLGACPSGSVKIVDSNLTDVTLRFWADGGMNLTVEDSVVSTISVSEIGREDGIVKIGTGGEAELTLIGENTIGELKSWEQIIDEDYHGSVDILIVGTVDLSGTDVFLRGNMYIYGDLSGGYYDLSETGRINLVSGSLKNATIALPDNLGVLTEGGIPAELKRGPVTINNCTFEANESGKTFSAIYVGRGAANGTDITITGCEFKGDYVQGNVAIESTGVVESDAYLTIAEPKAPVDLYVFGAANIGKDVIVSPDDIKSITVLPTNNVVDTEQKLEISKDQVLNYSLYMGSVFNWNTYKIDDLVGAKFSGIKAGANGITITKGSLSISGDMDATQDKAAIEEIEGTGMDVVFSGVNLTGGTLDVSEITVMNAVVGEGENQTTIPGLTISSGAVLDANTVVVKDNDQIPGGTKDVKPIAVNGGSVTVTNDIKTENSEGDLVSKPAADVVEIKDETGSSNIDIGGNVYEKEDLENGSVEDPSKLVTELTEKDNVTYNGTEIPDGLVLEDGKKLTITNDIDTTKTITVEEGATLKFSNVTFSGIVVTGTGDDANTIVMENVSGNFIITKGSVVIAGDMCTSTSGGITLNDGDILVVKGETSMKDITISVNEKSPGVPGSAQFIVEDTGKLEILGTVTLDDGITMSNDGQIFGEGTIYVDEKAAFYTNEPVSVMFNGPGTIVLEDAMETLKVSDKLASSIITQPTQTVVVTGDLTIKSGQYMIVLGTLEIPAGVTVKIENGGTLALNGVAAKAQIDGTIKSESENGFVVTDSADEAIIVTGEIIAAKGATDNLITVDINGPLVLEGTLTVNAKAVANFTTISVEESGTIVNNGTLKGSISNKGTVTINGSVDPSGITGIFIAAPTAVVDIISLKSGELGITDAGMYLRSVNGLKEAVGITNTSGYVDCSQIPNIMLLTNVKGLKVTEAIVYEKNASGDRVPVNHMYIEGTVTPAVSSNDGVDLESHLYVVLGDNVDVITELTVSKSGLGIASGATLNVIGKVYTNTEDLADDVIYTHVDDYTEKENVTIIEGDGQLIVTGLLTSVETEVSTNVPNISAVMYSETVQAITTYYYTNLADAIATGNKDLTVLGDLYILKDTTVPSGISIDAAGEDVYVGYGDITDVTFTIADGGFINCGDVTVLGTFIVEDTDTGAETGTIYSDTSSIGESDAMYTNIYNALAKSEAGDVITITSKSNIVYIDRDVTIPADVTLVIKSGKTVSILNGVTVNVMGTLENKGAVDSHARDINGSLLSDDDGFHFEPVVKNNVSGTEEKYSVITVTGKINSTTAMNYDTYEIQGAYYVLKGKYVITSVLNSAEDVLDAEGYKVEFWGKNVVDEVSFIGVADKPIDLVVKVHDDYDHLNATSPAYVGALSAKDLTIAFGKITFEANAIMNGTFGNEDGNITFANVMAGVTTVLSDETITIDDIDEQMLFVKGGIEEIDDKKTDAPTVTMAGAISIKETLDVCLHYTNPELEIPANGAGFLTIADSATVTITKMTLTLDAHAILVVDGTLVAEDNGKVSAENAEVYGVMDIREQTSKLAAGTVDITNLYVGGSVYDVDIATNGDTLANVRGTVDVLYLFPGNSVTGQLADQMADETTKHTQFYVEDALWLEVYHFGGSAANIVTGGTTATYNYIPSDLEDCEFVAWTDADGKKITTTKTIGEVDKVYALINYDIYKITVYAQAGINAVYIDGNMMLNVNINAGSIDGMTYLNAYTLNVKAGTHEIMYSLENGYSGKATMYIGGSAVEGLEFSCSGTEPTDKVVNISLQGIEKSGYVSEAPDTSAEKDGMSLVEILLIVLVVLILIMAIIVAMRLMRS